MSAKLRVDARPSPPSAPCLQTRAANGSNATRFACADTYHTRYSLERQALQDTIIRAMLKYEDMQRGRPARRSELDRLLVRGGKLVASQRQPWALFTAGCMGAGKTHVMCALDRHGLLPLPRFVRVDLDRIRTLLPENAGYVERDRRSAGQLTQKEAGLIAEIVSEEALARGLNVWIDSSMRDDVWWVDELQRIRRTYPHRMCILHVTASWERVQQRAAKRSEQTGRCIPLDVLRQTFKSVPASVAKLRPLVDEYIEVDNNGRRPRFRSSRDVRALLRLSREVQGDPESRALESWLPGF